MRRHLSALLLGLTLGLGSASAQQPATTPTAPAGPALPGASNTGDPPPAPLPYLFAAGFTIITLVIICVPSRKA